MEENVTSHTFIPLDSNKRVSLKYLIIDILFLSEKRCGLELLGVAMRDEETERRRKSDRQRELGAMMPINESMEGCGKRRERKEGDQGAASKHMYEWRRFVIGQ